MAKGRRSKKRRASAQRSGNRWPWILGGVGVLALIVVPIVLNVMRMANLPGERFGSLGNAHIQLGSTSPDYNSNPPTSGPHTPDLASWGAYGPDEGPPDQRLVHNMEDGGVILWYRPGTAEESEERIAALESVAQGYRRIVIAPREDMPTRYAFTAWQRLQRFEEIDREAMRAFIDAFEGIDHHPGV